MIKFSWFLKEEEHRDGTYVSVRPGSATAKYIHDWATEVGLCPIAPEELHTTVVYSRTPCPAIEAHDFGPAIYMATVRGWKLLGEFQDCLTLELESEDLQNLHKELRAVYGASHDFPEYIAHMTLCYDWNSEGPLPPVPDFPIIFNSVKVKPIDLDWKKKLLKKDR